mgnify:CR=1 FL=1
MPRTGKHDCLAADLTGQANHLGVTIQADIIKQKLPELNGGYAALRKALGGVAKFAEMEGLDAHGRSAAIRLEGR